MNHQERLMLGILKAIIDGHVEFAKACVRAAHYDIEGRSSRYSAGFRDARKIKTVEHLSTLRSIQVVLEEYCKGVGYHV
jgi:hypothetical protein